GRAIGIRPQNSGEIRMSPHRRPTTAAAACAVLGTRARVRRRAPAVAVFVCLLAATAAAASPPEVDHFDGSITFEPQVITDLPCLEGTQFLLNGSQPFHGTSVARSDGSFHVTFSQEFFSTLTPVD